MNKYTCDALQIWDECYVLDATNKIKLMSILKMHKHKL